MKDPTPGARHEPGRYEIRVAGRLEPRWVTRFDGMSLTTHDDGTTAIAGPVADQAALHGLLCAVRDLGLPLVSLARTQTDDSIPQPDPAPTPHITPHITPDITPQGD